MYSSNIKLNTSNQGLKLFSFYNDIHNFEISFNKNEFNITILSIITKKIIFFKAQSVISLLNDKKRDKNI